MKISFDLPASRLADAQTRVDRFARSAAKLGMSAPSLLVTCEYPRSWVVTEVGGVVAGPFDGFAPLRDEQPKRCRVDVLPMVRVEITGERPVIEGWDFVATIEHTSAGNLLNKVPGVSQELPAEYRTCGPDYCDHCNTSRKRSNTYLLRNTATGSYKRVGRSCLQTFLADASPEAWMSTFSFLRSIRELSEWDDGSGGFDMRAPFVSVPTFLAGVIESARAVGYVSASQAFGERCTGDAVRYALTDSNNTRRYAALENITAEDRTLAAAALAWVGTDDAGDSDYIHNLRVACKAGEVDHSNCRRIAALIPAFRKDLARRAVKATQVNEHLAAEIGERPVLDVTVGYINHYDGEFGRVYFVKMRTSCGRSIEWKTSNPCDAEGERVQEGDSFRLAGTVKEHGEYNGKLSTHLKICKLYPAGSDAKPLATAARKFAKLHGVDAPAWSWTAAAKKRAAKASKAAA